MIKYVNCEGLSIKEDNEYAEQANKFLNDAKSSMTIELMDEDRKDGFSCGGYDYKVMIKRNGKQWKFDFSDSKNNYQKSIAPTAYDILACLEKYEVGSFDDFCDEFGYEKHNEEYTGVNKESKRIYNAVTKEYRNVIRMFGDVIDELSEIQ